MAREQRDRDNAQATGRALASPPAHVHSQAHLPPQTASFEHELRSTRRPSKPNAYSYYQKLVQDFESLDNELRSAAHEQDALERKANQIRSQKQAVTREQHATQQREWEWERERQVECIVRQTDDVAAVRAQVDALDARELQLLAEIEVLQETQQAQVQTEAQRLHALVHTRTHLLDAELTKGQRDLEYIAQIVQRSRAAHAQSSDAGDVSANDIDSTRSRDVLQTLTDDVQQRRRADFEHAAAQLQARLHTFEQDKQALSQQAAAIRSRKQRALQILSINQQTAIQTFFTTPRAQHRTIANSSSSIAIANNASVSPELDFGKILASLNQSGVQVEQLQSARLDARAACKSAADALLDAQKLVQSGSGDQRIDVLQHTIARRKREAEALGVGSYASTYDGRFSVETYAPQALELVYAMRALVFSYVDAAVASSEAKPGRQQLERELERWQTTHSAVELEQNRRERSNVALAILTMMITDVVDDTARDIHAELAFSCDRVQTTITSVLRSVFFPPVAPAPAALRSSTATKTTAAVPTYVQKSCALAASLFASAFEQLQATRRQRRVTYEQRTHEHVTPRPSRHLQPMMQSLVSRSGARVNPASVPLVSPTKKRFGFSRFFHRQPEHVAVSLDAASTDKDACDPRVQECSAEGEGDADDDDSTQQVIELRAARAIPSSIASTSASATGTTVQEKMFWQHMLVDVDTCVAPTSFAHASCVALSTDASMCVVGTVRGELLVWDLLQRPPLLLRSHVPAAKGARASVLRVAISANDAHILALSALHTAQVWSIHSLAAASVVVGSNQHAAQIQTQTHSSDWFGVDRRKWKPLPLTLVTDVSATSLLEPVVPDRVVQLLVAPAPAPPPQHVLCVSFFALQSLVLGDQHSLLCGTTSGDVVKLNDNAGSAITRSDIAAAFDAPRPCDVAMRSALRRDVVEREWLRGHHHPVLFVTSLRRTQRCLHDRLVSVDSAANVLEWTYASAHFSGFGWFTPTRRYHLDLSVAATEAAAKAVDDSNSNRRGEILQIAATVDDQHLVLMVYYAHTDSAANNAKTLVRRTGTLRFYQLALHEAIDALLLRIELAFVASSAPPPRFALTTIAQSDNNDAQSFVAVLMDNSVSIYSLQSGERCGASLALQRKGETALMFDALAMSDWCRDDAAAAASRLQQRSCCCTIVVTGEQHNRAVVYRFLQPPPPPQ